MKEITGKVFDEERALYGSHDLLIANCSFSGPADGESALKECGNIQVKDCRFALRYPFWHVSGAEVTGCSMEETCRAALWYDRDVVLKGCSLQGIKALRECDHTLVEACEISSQEFGWFCRDLTIRNSTLVSEYPFLQSRNLVIENLKMTGKYRQPQVG